MTPNTVLITIITITVICFLAAFYITKSSKVVIKSCFFIGLLLLLFFVYNDLINFIENNPQIILPGIGIIIVLSIIFYFLNAFKKLKEYKNDEKLYNEKKAQIKSDIQNVLFGIVIFVIFLLIIFVSVVI